MAFIEKRESLVAQSPFFFDLSLSLSLSLSLNDFTVDSRKKKTSRNKKRKQALLQLEYPDKLQRLLLTPQREVLVELVVTRDNGEIEVKRETQV